MIFKETIKKASLPKQKAKTQKAFNAYIRKRDAEKGCVSCKTGKVEQASHFYSAGNHSALRFNEDNCHGSCLKCNYFLSGNLLPYRQALLTRIGFNRVSLLESVATRGWVKKWTVGELIEIEKLYKIKIKELA